MRTSRRSPSTGPRRGFTLVEVAFVMIIASVIMMILIQIMRQVSTGADKGQKKLDFLRQASILLDRVRQDIRGAGRGPSVSLGGGGKVTIVREGPSGKSDDAEAPTQEVLYEFDETNRVVTRTVKGGKDETTTYGSAGAGVGFITHFEVGARSPELPGPTGEKRPVSGFYEVKISFASQEEFLEAQKRGEKARGSNIFRALVSKRAPEVKDDLWKPNN